MGNSQAIASETDGMFFIINTDLVSLFGQIVSCCEREQT